MLTVGDILAIAIICYSRGQLNKLADSQFCFGKWMYTYRNEIVVINITVLMGYLFFAGFLNLDFSLGNRVILMYNIAILLLAIFLRKRK